MSDAGQDTVVWDAAQRAVVLQYTQDSHNKQVVSKDLGATWGPAADVVLPAAVTGAATGPGRGLQLSSTNPVAPGRLLFIGHHGAYVEDYVWYSDDGVHWNVSRSDLAKMDEAQLVELHDGRVLANMRNNHANASCACRGIAISADGGASFGPVSYDPQLPEPVCMASVVAAGGRFYFANPGTVHGRTNGAVRMSPSGLPGTWVDRQLVVNANGSYAYSCLTDLPAAPQYVGLLWETNLDRGTCDGDSCNMVFSLVPTSYFDE